MQSRGHGEEVKLDQPLVVVKDLTIAFPVQDRLVSVVDSLSFSLYRKSVLGIVGETGSGKTMTVWAMLGLVPPPGQVIKGEIWFDGENLLCSPEATRRVRGTKIAMVFQDPYSSLNPFYTIGDQIAHVLNAHDQRRKDHIVEESITLLHQVGIPDPPHRIKDYPLQLSGGMRQRVMIALALANKPTLLIADEPTSSLDVTIQAQILELFSGIRREHGTTIIFISHDLGVIAEIADEVLVIYAGQAMESGSIDDIFVNPLHPYTRGLLSTIPRLGDNPERLPIVKGSLPSLADMGQGCRFFSRCAESKPICEVSKPGLTAASFTHQVYCHIYQVQACSLR